VSTTIRRDGVSTTSAWIDIFQAAFLRREMGNKPGQLPHFLLAGVREDESGVADRFQFDDLGDLNPADTPVHSTSLSNVAAPQGRWSSRRRDARPFGPISSIKIPALQRCWFLQGGATDHLHAFRVEQNRQSQR
jgi:hypothetical protein